MLATDVAFRAHLSDRKHPAKVRGRKQPPSLDLLALLLAIPSTTASLVRTKDGLNPTSLQLRCKDRSGVEMVVTAALEPTPAKRILQEMHESLFSAIVALEATVRDAGGEKHSNFLEDKGAQPPSLSTVKTSMLPLVIRGQPVETQAVFRRAAAADARMQGNRAFVVANAAARVRTELLEQRRARKEAEMLKKKRERELLRAAKRKHEMMKAAKGKPAPAVKRRKKSLFEIAEEDSETAPVASNFSTAQTDATASEGKDSHARILTSDAVSGSIQPKNRTEETRQPETLETRKTAVKEEDVTIDAIEPRPSAARRPPLKRKKKKKVRALV